MRKARPCLFAAILSLPCISSSSFRAADCDQDGIEDLLQIASGASADCNANGVPDACDVLPVSFGFEAGQRLEAEGGYWSPVAADFDGDGSPDVAVAAREAAGPTLRVLANAGGELRLAATLAAAEMPDDLAAADFDRDGDMDLAAVERLRGAVVVLPNLGAGGFGPGVRHPTTAAGGVRVAAADWNRDGAPDLAVLIPRCVPTSEDQLDVLLGDGSGSFLAPRIFKMDACGSELASGDLDGDGDQDIAAAAGNLAVRLLLGDGRGQFFRGEARQVPWGVHSLLALDLDADLDLDVAVGTRASEVSVLRNEGRGALGEAIGYPLEAACQALAAADLDGDGAPDFFAAEARNARLAVLLAQGGGFGVARRFRLANPAHDLLAVELGPGVLPALIALDGGGLSVLGSGPARLEDDCDLNGVPDECDLLRGEASCQDCRAYQDLFSCDEVPFVLGFEAPAFVAGDPGALLRFEATLRLRGRGPPRPEVEAVQGWAALVTAAGGRIVAATSRGTVADFPPAGLRDAESSWARVGLVQARPGGRCPAQAATAVVLSFVRPASFNPFTAPTDLLRFTVEARIPETGTGSGLCFLRNVLEPCEFDSDLISGSDGGGGDHPLARAGVTASGDSFEPLLEDRTVVLVPLRTPFRRGDANADGRADISDAIRTFMYLFLGAAGPACADGADANDDGRLDLSDGITILDDFFREGTAIPAPGPFDCGPDPTPDSLICASQDACSA